MEIERTIDEAMCDCRQHRSGGRQETPEPPIQASSRENHSGSLSPHRQRERFWGQNRVRSVSEESEMVTARGKAPRESFEWLKDQLQTDWRNRKLIEKCFFEKR
jgi:hypothetical protein